MTDITKRLMDNKELGIFSDPRTENNIKYIISPKKPLNSESNYGTKKAKEIITDLCAYANTRFGNKTKDGYYTLKGEIESLPNKIDITVSSKETLETLKQESKILSEKVMGQREIRHLFSHTSKPKKYVSSLTKLGGVVAAVYFGYPEAVDFAIGASEMMTEGTHLLSPIQGLAEFVIAAGITVSEGFIGYFGGNLIGRTLAQPIDLARTKTYGKKWRYNMHDLFDKGLKKAIVGDFPKNTAVKNRIVKKRIAKK